MPGISQLPQLKEMLGDLKPMLEATLEFTVAHEAAHQWFAMMVGSDPIEEPVVDEPLTQHAALLYLEWKHGKANADAMRNAQLKSAYHVMRLMGGADGPAARSTRDFESTNEYAALIYGKAPLFYDQARVKVGDEKYFKTLRAYCDELRWGMARPDTFTKTLGKLVPAQAKALEKLRKRWWDEAHGDEDLGKPDLGAMFGGAPDLSGGAGGQLDAETTKMLEEAIRALQGE
jgi:aminopeptidase N